MKKQMALKLTKKEQLVTVWGRLGETNCGELVKQLASLIAATTQAELDPAEKEGSDEQQNR